MYEQLTCPGCVRELEIPPRSDGQLVRCSYCGAEFFASEEASHLQVVDDTLPTMGEPDPQIAFDKLRIEHFTALRMGAIRARSWWLIATCMCTLIALDMAGKTAMHIAIEHRFGAWIWLQIALGAAAIFAAQHSWWRAVHFKNEIDQSAIPEPTTPPDFSTLGNGSDRWKNLENVR